MRNQEGRKLTKEGKLTYGILSGAVNPRTGEPYYREVRPKKNPSEEIAVARINKAAEKRLRKRNKNRPTTEEQNDGQVEASENGEVSQVGSAASPQASVGKIQFDFE